MASFNSSTGILTIDNTSQIIEELEKQLQAAFNNPKFTIEDNENIGQIFKVLGDREEQLQQTIDIIYGMTCFNGLEGAYLDNALSLIGVFREPATAGSGDAVVQTDINAQDSTPIASGTVFSGNNGIQYKSLQENLVANRVTAYRLDISTAPLATYNFTITNRQTDQVLTKSITLANTTVVARDAFINTLKDFLESVNPEETNIYTSYPFLYYGFDQANEVVGLGQTVDFAVTPSLGNRYTLVECVATETGFNPLPAQSIESMNILPVGYVSVSNIGAFSSGTDIETDAAFIERSSQLSDSVNSKATRDAVVSGLLRNVAGVQTVRLDKTVSGGEVTVNPIIIGGEIQDIVNELYRTQPVNNIYSGDISATVTTLDDSSETIRFTRGVEVNLDVRVKYKTTNNTSLSESEKESITNSLVAFGESWGLGETIFNYSLAQAVGSSVSVNRFSRLVVEVKESGQPEDSYSTNDYIAPSNELPKLISSGVFYLQEVV